MRCFVHKSLRKADTYIYLREGDGIKALPSALLAAVGALQLVLEFELTPERRLARVDATQVLEALERQGYYVQLPATDPSSDDAGLV